MLEFKNFSLEYTNSLNLKEKLFENINVSFKKASINVITGQSGSGKSTLLKTINGIIPEITGAKLSGELVYNGKNLFEEHKEAELFQQFFKTQRINFLQLIP